jgi:beta-mannosidase
MEELEWTYKKSFYMSSKNIANCVELVCDGLDTTCDIWLNGEQVGSSNNALVQHRFDITSLVKAGQNEIVIRIDPGFKAVEGKDVDRFKRTWNAYDLRRPWIRKAQQTYYWDVAPRMVTCGIWRDIYIESHDKAVIRDIYTTSRIEGDKALVDTEIEIEALGNGEYTLQMDVYDENVNLTEKTSIKLGKGLHKQTLKTAVSNPKLWWPNGMGEQHLYHVIIKVFDADGRLLDTKNYRHGVRTIKVVQEKLNDKESTFTFVVNGVKIFCKGGNWVPSDCIYGRINKKDEVKLLQYAKDANFNMMRIWGGGV